MTKGRKSVLEERKICITLPGIQQSFLLFICFRCFTHRCPPPPISLASPDSISEAVALLCGAQRPLVVVGKGAAYAHAEEQVQRLLEKTGLPFLPTPMGMKQTAIIWRCLICCELQHSSKPYAVN